MGSTPLVKFIREHIRDSGDVFCISSLVKVSSFSVIKFVTLIVGVSSKHRRVFLESVRQSSVIFVKFWKCLVAFVWPSDKFCRIFGNNRKVVWNLWKIVKSTVTSLSIIKGNFHDSEKIWILCSGGKKTTTPRMTPSKRWIYILRPKFVIVHVDLYSTLMTLKTCLS